MMGWKGLHEMHVWDIGLEWAWIYAALMISGRGIWVKSSKGKMDELVGRYCMTRSTPHATWVLIYCTLVHGLVCVTIRVNKHTHAKVAGQFCIHSHRSIECDHQVTSVPALLPNRDSSISAQDPPLLTPKDQFIAKRCTILADR